MDSLSFRVSSNLDDMGELEIRIFGWGRADKEALIHLRHMHGVLVSFRVDAHSWDTQVVTGASHSASNLASIGNHDLIEQFAHSLVYFLFL